MKEDFESKVSILSISTPKHHEEPTNILKKISVDADFLVENAVF